MNKCIRESRSFLMLGEVFVCTCQRMAGILCVYLRRMYENNLMHSKEFNKKKKIVILVLVWKGIFPT